MTQEQWIAKKLEEYKTDPGKLFRELFINTTDAMNDSLFIRPTSAEAFQTAKTAAMMNTELLIEIKKWDDLNPKEQSSPEEKKSGLILMS